MDNLFFVAPYVSEDVGRKMSCTPSSITYSKYLIGVFSRFKSKKIKVLSLCTSKDYAYFSRKEIELCNHTELYFKSLPSRWGMSAVRFSQIWLYLQVFFYLLSNVQKNDTVVIYHDYGLSFFYKFFKRFIGCRVIYLVAEVFNAVYDRGEDQIAKECRRLSGADAYIYINDILPILFDNNKDFAVCYGNYLYCDRPKLKDDRIHILFAGKISQGIINDAFIALDVIKYLSNAYFLHVAGYGEEEDIEELNKKIEVINSNAGITRVIFEGNLSGEDYEELLSKCQIGLCTRTLRNELSNYCFPSKTMVYLTHDIIPICPSIDILLKSKVSSRLEFVKEELSPKSIADIIQRISCFETYCNREIIKDLDDQLERRLKQLL